jgi:UDP-2-acetamido-3-amino-2,3-dideoxy-glucuronate N-acetyltransferase
MSADTATARNALAHNPAVKVHESAYVDAGCTIGDGTKIWHFSHIMPDCEIGEHCNIGQNVVVSPGVKLGRNCKIQNNVSLYTGVVMEDDVFCGPSMVFTNINNPRSEIVRRDQYATTLIRTGASMGANSTIVCGSTVGRYAFVAAGAVVAKDVPDYAMMMGVPAKRRGWACRCGHLMADAPGGTGEITCAECGNVYNQTGEHRLEPVRETQGQPQPA